MPSVRDLRDRIRSMKNTQQITKAMKQVAAAKIRRADALRKQSRPYADALAQMLQDLLAERFKLSFHHEQKEMAIFELTVGEQNTKMKHSAPDALPAEEDPPWVIPEFSLGQDGCPVFPPGRGGLMGGGNGCYRWTGFNLSMVEIAKTLSFHLGRPVVDATGLKEKYDVDMTWSIDVTRFMEGLEGAGLLDQTGEAADYGPRGPTLIHAVRDQLGLKLNSKKGLGDVVVVDHVEKVPTEN